MFGIFTSSPRTSREPWVSDSMTQPSKKLEKKVKEYPSGNQAQDLKMEVKFVIRDVQLLSIFLEPQMASTKDDADLDQIHELEQEIWELEGRPSLHKLCYRAQVTLGELTGIEQSLAYYSGSTFYTQWQRCFELVRRIDELNDQFLQASVRQQHSVSLHADTV